MTLEPQPFLVVDDPGKLKAFTDPLRIRILASLAERVATNQQLAHSLGAPQPNVLYHLRFLRRAGLIELVDTQIKGGNVEKYYRAVARTFELRPGMELHPAISGAEFAALSQEMALSASRWPDDPPQFVIRPRKMTSAQARDFYSRLFAFIHEYWDNAPMPDTADDQAQYYCTAAVFRGERDEK